MNKEITEKVEKVEIWEVDNNGEFRVAKKLIAVLLNGYPYYIADGYFVEKSILSKEEAEHKYAKKLTN